MKLTLAYKTVFTVALGVATMGLLNCGEDKPAPTVSGTGGSKGTGGNGAGGSKTGGSPGTGTGGAGGSAADAAVEAAPNFDALADVNSEVGGDAAPDAA